MLLRWMEVEDSSDKCEPGGCDKVDVGEFVLQLRVDVVDVGDAGLVVRHV